MTYTEECQPAPAPVCRTVYETVCGHGGYSAHSYSALPSGHHKREAEAEADPEARDGKSYPGNPAHGYGGLGYGLVPPPLGFGPRLKLGHPQAYGKIRLILRSKFQTIDNLGCGGCVTVVGCHGNVL